MVPELSTFAVLPALPVTANADGLQATFDVDVAAVQDVDVAGVRNAQLADGGGGAVHFDRALVGDVHAAGANRRAQLANADGAGVDVDVAGIDFVDVVRTREQGRRLVDAATLAVLAESAHADRGGALGVRKQRRDRAGGVAVRSDVQIAAVRDGDRTVAGDENAGGHRTRAVRGDVHRAGVVDAGGVVTGHEGAGDPDSHGARIAGDVELAGVVDVGVLAVHGDAGGAVVEGGDRDGAGVVDVGNPCLVRAVRMDLDAVRGTVSAHFDVTGVSDARAIPATRVDAGHVAGTDQREGFDGAGVVDGRTTVPRGRVDAGRVAIPAVGMRQAAVGDRSGVRAVGGDADGILVVGAGTHVARIVDGGVSFGVGVDA